MQFKTNALCLAAIFGITGCATAPATSWQHTSITDRQTAAKQFLQDIDHCTLVAAGAAPMPAIPAPQQSTTTNVSGQIRTYNTTTGQTTNSTYSGVAQTVPSGGFAGGFASGLSAGASLGAAIAASDRRERLEKLCMTNKGWVEVPAGSSFAAPAVTQATGQTQNTAPPATADRQIYDSPEKEWAADVNEFLQFYPAYSSSGELYKALDQQVRVIANGPQSLSAPKILSLAHRAVVSSGKVASEPVLANTLPFKTYLKAVDGSAIDQAGLGVMYTKGVDHELPKDLVRAAYWSQKSALSGNTVGQLSYGMLVFWGMGVKQNRVQGYKWVKLSASIDSRNIEVLKRFESEMTPEEISASR